MLSVPQKPAESGQAPPPGSLRQQLYELTEHQPLEAHASSMAGLRTRFPQSQVHLLGSPYPWPVCTFNCIMYALDMVGQFEPTLYSDDGHLFHYVTGTAFLNHAIRSGLLVERNAYRLAESDLAVYFDGAGTQTRHIARVCARQRLCSKWGAGHIYAHGLWEVPINYGSQVRFFQRPSRQRILRFLAERQPGLRMSPTEHLEQV